MPQQTQTEREEAGMRLETASDAETETILEILRQINDELEEIASKIDEIGRID